MMDLVDAQKLDSLADGVTPLTVMGKDGSLPPVVVPVSQLDSPAYSPLAVLHRTGAAPSIAVASCPHAGRDYPEPLIAAATLPVEAMRGLEDFGVDQLVAGLASGGITCVINHVARAYIDVNRPAGALDAEMFDTPLPTDKPSRQVTAGYGLIPRLSALRQPIYNAPLPASEAAHRLAQAHLPYHSMLAAQIAAAKAEHGRCLLVDIHSMPPRDRTNRKLADIILGDCLGTTIDPGPAQAIDRFFRDAGLTTAWNEPYSGGYITHSHGRIRTPNQAVQIEINRALYMADTTLSARNPRLDVDRTRAMTALFTRFADFLNDLMASGH